MGYALFDYQGLQERYGKPKKDKRTKKPYSTTFSEWLEMQGTAKTKKKVKSKKRKYDYNNLLKDKRWLKKREAVLNAKGHVCSQCGSKCNLQVHHLHYKYGRMPWEYPISNFVVLCENCHKKAHGLK